MTAAKEFELVSIEDYLTGEEKSDIRHEFLNGRVFAMAGGKVRHNRIKSRVLLAFRSQLREPCETFDSDMKVRVRSGTKTFFYYPDAMVVCDSNPGDDTFQDRPVAIVEVISESTRRTDEGEKRDSYLTIPSLQYYILLEQDSAAGVVYAKNDCGDFDRTIYSDPCSIIPLPAISVELSLEQIYRGEARTDNPN